jgi:hypothetical protein
MWRVASTVRRRTKLLARYYAGHITIKTSQHVVVLWCLSLFYQEDYFQTFRNKM